MSGNKDLGGLDVEDQEIPDRATAKAAEWLSAQDVKFETPLFWLVSGLLANHAASERRLAVEAERDECASIADEITIYTNDDCFRVRNRITTAIRARGRERADGR
jgi:hypothetical protein